MHRNVGFATGASNRCSCSVLVGKRIAATGAMPAHPAERRPSQSRRNPRRTTHCRQRRILRQAMCSGARQPAHRVAVVGKKYQRSPGELTRSHLQRKEGRRQFEFVAPIERHRARSRQGFICGIVEQHRRQTALAPAAGIAENQ